MIKFLAYLLCYLFYPLSFLIPRRRDLLIFGSFGGGFVENTKYLYLYCREHLPSCRPVWISTKKSTAQTLMEKNLEAYWVGSLRGIWMALRGKYWFVNCYTSDILFCLAGGVTLVNLWHGIPWKCIEYSITSGPLAKRYTREDKWDVFYHPAPFRKPNYILSTTPFVTEILARSFRVPQSICVEAGFPRDYLLGRPKEEVTQFIRQYESPATLQLVQRLQHYGTVYIYMPTWRDSQRDFFAGGMNLDMLNATMVEQDAVMLIKPHPNTFLPPSISFSNLVFVENSTDIYCILPFTDVLVTDYSSIMFDYPIMPNKGMILYQYDYKEYILEREFNFPLENNLIGHKAETFEQLLDLIRRHDYRIDSAERQRFLQKFWGSALQPGDKVCKNILNEIIRL